MRAVVLAGLLVSTAPSRPAAVLAPLPWNASGHRIVAHIVWEELSAGARAQLGAILKQHPRYEKDLLGGLAPDADEAAAVRHAFAAAAVWPDAVRGVAHPLHATADHPRWHYVDLPYVLESQPVPPQLPADEPGPRNVLEALPKVVAELTDPSLAPPDRALALCWILHLVADVHQPLHACSLYSPQFPNGDQGGNGFSVLREPRSGPTNLHHLWDSLPGSYQAEELELYLAAGMRADPRLARARVAEALAVKDFAAWARESHALAVEHAYRNGTLKGAVAQQPAASRPARDESRRQTPLLPVGYVEQAERVALRRLVLAGYRCADLLETALQRQ